MGGHREHIRAREDTGNRRIEEAMHSQKLGLTGGCDTFGVFLDTNLNDA
jgi:hypothetical protein